MINDRIEQALRTWEVCTVNSKISMKRINMLKHGEVDDEFVGPLLHYHTFRKDVLAGKPFDARKYLPIGVNSAASGAIGHFPAAAHAWAQKSRRIYHLDSDIQELILQTNVNDITWADLVFPFNAFGIALSRPIQEPNGQLFDFLLVHKGYIHSIKNDGIAIWAISKEFERPEAISLKQIERVYDELVTRNKFRKSVEVTDSLTSQWAADETSMGAKLNCFIADGRLFHQPLRDTFSYIKENEGKVADHPGFEGHVLPFSSMGIEIERLVAGFCVYLQSHRGDAAIKVQTNWEPKENPTLDPNCITREALVCSVQNVYDIEELERELLMIHDPVERKRRCDELGVHYREGHLRKAPNTAHIPGAPQIVHVRPSIIGLRRLAAGALPPGVAKAL